MRRRLLVLSVICLQAFVTACGAQTEQASPEKDVVPSTTLKNPKLWLNHEPMGDIENLSKLSSTLSRIMNEREDQGVFSDGGRNSSGPRSLTANGIYITVPPDLSLGDLAKVYKVVDENCTVQIPKPAPKEVEPDVVVSPNPLILRLNIGKQEVLYGSMQLPDLDADRKYSYDLSMGTTSDADDLWLARVTGSLEVLADDSVIVNERDFRGDAPAKYPPKQRQMKSTLKEEIAGLRRESGLGKDIVHVIVSRLASFKSLAEILKQADEQNLKVEILVNAVD